MVTTSSLLPVGPLGDSLPAIETPDNLDAPGFRPAGLTLDEIRVATHQDSVGQERYDRYVVCNDYYEGRQRDPRALSFDSNDLSRDRNFSSRHNLCAPVIDIQVERLTVAGFHVSDTEGQRQTATDDLSTLLWRWWQANRMDAKARAVHRRTFKFGDAYVLIEWDSVMDRPRYCLEDPRQIVPLYDVKTGALRIVYKAWVEVPAGDPPAASLQARIRINKYQPGLIEKFVGTQGSQRFDYYDGDTYPDGQSDGGLILWVDRTGAPLPIPIVHFKHVADDEGNFGRSDLADVMPMQDTFNMRTWATSQAAVFDGARIKYAINIEALVDERTGEKRRPPIGANAVWWLNPEDPDKPVEIGTLEPGDPSRLQEVADRELKTIAGLTGIPMHLIWPEGGLPSGEALKTAEARLVSKLTDRTITMGNAWEDVQYLAIRLANTFAAEALPEDLMITTTWDAVESRSALIEEQVITSRSGDLSWQQRMRERGYSVEEIAQIEAERDDEQEAAPAPAPALPAGGEGESMQPAQPAEGDTAG